MSNDICQGDPRPKEHGSDPLRASFKAMSTTVNVKLVGPGPNADEALSAAEAVFRRVETTCTRFDPSSPLMKANAAGEAWCSVPFECFCALSEAELGHRETQGLFDPRVLDALVSLGYDRSLPFRSGPVKLDAVAATSSAAPPMDPPPVTGAWTPELDPAGSRVRIGPRAVDLGGIGKGMAVRMAAETLANAASSYMIEAGGDCYFGGKGPRQDGWRVGVENPLGGDKPIAMLNLVDIGCVTSSLRVRTWHLGNQSVHHLIDPRTGRSAQSGLKSVTVVGPDPARDEVWSKALLVSGRDQIAEMAREHDLAALWVDDEGQIGHSPSMSPWLRWMVPHCRPTEGAPREAQVLLDARGLSDLARSTLKDRTAMLTLLQQVAKILANAKQV